jgi:hypothetical protein
MKTHFVETEKVPGLAVLVCIPVGPASAAAMAAAMQGRPVEAGDSGPAGGGHFELGAACAAAAARIEGKIAAAGLKQTRAASVRFGVHEGSLCVGVVTDKTAARVKTLVKIILTQACRVSAGEHNACVRGLGQTPKLAAECVAALQRGAADASVIVCGPLSKPAKQRQALDKAKEGAEAATIPKASGAALKGGALSAPAGQHMAAAKGVVLSVLSDYVRGELHVSGCVSGDALLVPAKVAGALARAGENKDKRARLLAQLEKPGETARACWRACAQGIPVSAVPTPKAIADGVFAALK